jgi:hypothetical protein
MSTATEMAMIWNDCDIQMRLDSGEIGELDVNKSDSTTRSASGDQQDEEVTGYPAFELSTGSGNTFQEQSGKDERDSETKIREGNGSDELMDGNEIFRQQSSETESTADDKECAMNCEDIEFDSELAEQKRDNTANLYPSQLVQELPQPAEAAITLELGIDSKQEQNVDVSTTFDQCEADQASATVRFDDESIGENGSTKTSIDNNSSDQVNATVA